MLLHIRHTLACLVLVISLSVNAQVWEVGGMIGFSNFFNTGPGAFSIKETHRAWGPIVRYNYSEKVSFKSNIYLGSV
ncbi:MAG: hypothetical protein IH946_08875 [Bacteroidetes bacterium]|nr:hypothetical protein [Bacteroidota bacterium]